MLARICNMGENALFTNTGKKRMNQKLKNPMVFFNLSTGRNEDCSISWQSKKYVKKPVEIIAIQTAVEGIIATPEGMMKFEKGDYLVEGVKGEHYPVKKEIFEETYEVVNNDD